MIDDPFRTERLTDATVPADRWFAITPSDSEDLAVKPRAIFVGTGGDLVLFGADGVSATFAVADGAMLPLSPHRVMATGTTATGIVGMW